MNTQPLVSVIILNWNGKDFLKQNLDSVLGQTYRRFIVTVVDNDSKDGSVEFIEKNYPQIKLIRLPQNYGFGKGINIGIKDVLKDKSVEYIVLLNHDIKIDKGFLSELVKSAVVDKTVGIFAPKMLRLNNPKIIDSTGHISKWGRIVDRGYKKVDNAQYDNKKDNIIGACSGACLYKREMLENIGLFDEGFFVYYDDAELSWRAYRKGWKAKFVPTSVAYHKRKSVIKKDKNLTYKLKYLALRNMVTTVKRHGTGLQKFLFTILLIKEGSLSFAQKLLGRISLGAKPYIDSIRRVWRVE